MVKITLQRTHFPKNDMIAAGKKWLRVQLCSYSLKPEVQMCVCTVRLVSAYANAHTLGIWSCLEYVFLFMGPQWHTRPKHLLLS